MSLFDYLMQNRADVLLRSLQHIGLVSISVGVAVAIGIPLGVLITRKPTLRGPVLAVANVVQTIPSLALFGFLLAVPFIGLGARNAIIALVVYSLLPIIRNTYTGVTGVDPAVRDAARGMGMTAWQLLRIVAVGIATIAAAIGAGGLGVFIFRGLSMVDNGVIMAGAILAAILALVVDGGLHVVERRLDWRVER